MGIRHAFTSAKAAASDATLVDGPDWNADHVGERAQSSTTPATIGTAAVGIGTTDARADHVHAITELDAILASPVTLTVAGTFYDLVSVVLSVGTWLIWGQSYVDGSASGSASSARLYNSTGAVTLATAWSSAAASSTAVGPAKIVVAAGTPTIKLQAASEFPGNKAQPALLTRDTTAVATRIVAIKIA